MKLPKKLLLILCLTAVSLFFISSLNAQPETLKPAGFVNDFANIIDAGTEEKLSALLTSYENATGNEIAVVTVRSLDGLPIEDYAVDLFKEWEIGKKGKDNGFLILVAPNERKMRIESGYGSESAINDAAAGRIVRDTMIPWFTKGDFSTGILNGTVESINIINKRYKIDFDMSKSSGISYKHIKSKRSPFSLIPKLIIIGIIILIFIKNPWAGMFLLMGMSGGRCSSRSGGFGGGGFGGFGGGMSGGGGASGSW